MLPRIFFTRPYISLVIVGQNDFVDLKFAGARATAMIILILTREDI